MKRLLTQTADDIPFDLKHKRHIVYNGSIQSLRDQLTCDLKWALSEIDTVNRSRINVTVKSIGGELDKTKYSATAKLTFHIDMYNESDTPSAEIDAIYLYTIQRWNVTQNGNSCPITDSDNPIYDHRYFLTSPVKRLQRSGWAQIRFNTERLIASVYRGDELKDEYHITGHCVLRLVTDRGSFDYGIPIDTKIEEFPF